MKPITKTIGHIFRKYLPPPEYDIVLWFFRYVTGVLLYLAIHRIRTREFEVEGDIMMIVAALAEAFNVVLGLLLHGVCHIPHSHSHHSHLPETETHAEEESDNDEPESQVRILKNLSNGSFYITLRCQINK